MAAITDDPRDGLGGDPDAVIRQLYSGHARALHAYVERFCPDRASADDIVQETFIRAWRHLPQLSADDRPVRPWLFRVARNLLIDGTGPPGARPMTVQAQPAGEIGIDSGMEEVLHRQLVSAALQHLSPAPERAGGDLLPGRHHGHRRPRARHPGRHGQITAALRAGCAAPAARRPRRDRVLMAGRMPWDITAAGADGDTAAPAAGPRPGRHLIAVLLLGAAVLGSSSGSG